jgi:hypothetical protein
MDGLDYGQLSILLISIVLGSSGIVGWILTYMQLRRETRQRALQQFRELVLTPDFLQFLGLLHIAAVASANVLSYVTASEQILTNTALTAEDRFRRLKELEDESKYLVTEMRRATRRVTKDFPRINEKVIRTGVLFLMPDKIEKEIAECMRLFVAAKEPNEHQVVTDRLQAIFVEIKRILGLTTFE